MSSLSSANHECFLTRHSKVKVVFSEVRLPFHVELSPERLSLRLGMIQEVVLVSGFVMRRILNISVTQFEVVGFQHSLEVDVCSRPFSIGIRLVSSA